MTSVIHSFLFQFFTDTRVGISPAGSAVIGPQIAPYILLVAATKKLNQTNSINLLFYTKV